MKKSPSTLEGSYQYDALDRLTTRNATHRFYQDERIATEIEGERKTRFFETDSQPLALQQHGSGVGTTLLATDQQSSVLSGVSPDGTQHGQVYTPFGYHVHDALLSAIGFNGERPELETGHYLLGQGYRAFNPVLMRFNSPDSWSPFGEGGINAYAYCDNDPLNKTDATGHLPSLVKSVLRSVHLISPSATSKKTMKLLNQKIKETDNTIQAGLKKGVTPIKRDPSIATLSKTELINRANKLSTEITQQNTEIDSIISKIFHLNNKIARHTYHWGAHYAAQLSEGLPSYRQVIAQDALAPPSWKMVEAGENLMMHRKLLQDTLSSVQNKKLERNFIDEQLVRIRGNK